MALTIFSLPLASSTPFLHPTLHSRDINTTTVSSWSNITASPSLIWTPCFANYTCSLLTVPLDYANPSIGTTNIAYIRLSSNASDAQDIVINPGGPGGSGVDTVLTSGALLSQYLGPSYNIIGFDPRGVGQSGPSLDCFPDAPEAKARLEATFGRPIDIQDPRSLSEEFAKAGAYGEWCSRVHKDGDAKYANTPATATDMLNYAEQAIVLSGGKKEDAKLWYYGLSYGTALGATFASLFPERIGRMILDGVVDSEDYYLGAWGKNLDQADEAVESFFTYCHAAGPDKCVFYANSTQQISARLSAIIDDIRANPIPVSDPSFVDYPTIATYETLVFALIASLYTPSAFFPLLAQILDDLSYRNGSLLASQFTPDKYSADGPGPLILCMDAGGRYNLSSEQKWEAHVARINEQSKWVGNAWASVAVVCKDLDIVPPSGQRIFGVPSANTTASPILFIGNTVDPVTPIRGAHKMAGLFGGSRVLEQKSVGHCSVSDMSTCTAGYIQGYLGDGKLPELGTVCEPDAVPFEGGSGIPLR